VTADLQRSSARWRRTRVWSCAVVISLASWGGGNPAVTAFATPGDDPTSGGLEPEAGTAPPSTVIQLRGGRLTVKVRNAPWRTVLNEFARQTGIEVAVKGPFRGELTEEFETSNLEEGLRRLFRGADVILFYANEARGEESTVVARAWLFPRQAASGRRSPPRENDDEAKPLRALDALAAKRNTTALQTALVDSDLEVQTRALQLLTEQDGLRVVDRLLHMASSEDPMTRLQALSVLHKSPADETTILSALGTALADRHGAVREYAIEALASRGGSGAMAYLQQALRDPDPKVRMMILENVAQHGQAHALLQQGLSDSDNAVRELAGILLTQLGSHPE